MFKGAKYLLGFTIPALVFVSLYFGGLLSFSATAVSFFLLPLIERFMPVAEDNLSPEEEQRKANQLFYDFLVWLNVPIAWSLTFFYFTQVSDFMGNNAAGWLWWEMVGMTMAMGMLYGTCVSVAHELGHRVTWHERLFARMLLLPAIFLHYPVEHNRGHHLLVGTDEDPSSARKGETFYAFFPRAVFGVYRKAWQIEHQDLRRRGYSIWSWRNEMLVGVLVQALYLVGIGLYFGWAVLPFLVGAIYLCHNMVALVDYIEHYGLRRKKLPSGKYERVEVWHSWNSSHAVGRMTLFELTRHSDHHYKATRKYQTLRHFEESPQLPMGYPGAMLVAMIPPLWFKKVDPLVEHYSRKPVHVSEEKETAGA